MQWRSRGVLKLIGKEILPYESIKDALLLDISIPSHLPIGKLHLGSFLYMKLDPWPIKNASIWQRKEISSHANSAAMLRPVRAGIEWWHCFTSMRQTGYSCECEDQRHKKYTYKVACKSRAPLWIPVCWTGLQTYGNGIISSVRNASNDVAQWYPSRWYTWKSWVTVIP